MTSQPVLGAARVSRTHPREGDPEGCEKKDWNSFCSLISHHSWSQENSPTGSKVLQLILSDPDSPENGPPYSFQITQGNDGSAFQVTPDGWLVTTEGLSKRVQEWYQLQIEVRAVLGPWQWPWGQKMCWQNMTSASLIRKNNAQSSYYVPGTGLSTSGASLH